MPREEKTRYKRFSKKYVENYASSRRAWISFGRLSFRLYVGFDDNAPPSEEDEVESKATLPPVRLLVQPPGKAAFTINLTRYTEEELNLFREFMNLACETALSSCRELDQLAKEGLEHGDDSYTRLYRQIPRLFVRRGVLPSDDQGVPIGPVRVRDLGGDDDLSDDGIQADF